MRIAGGINEKTDEFVSIAAPISINAPNKTFITREEAARLANKSTKTIDRLIKSGNLETISLGRRVFIVPESLEKYMGRPLQSVSTDEAMMIIPCTIYDQMKERLYCAEAKVAQLATAEKNIADLQDRYDNVAQQYEQLQKNMSSQSWYQKLFSGYFVKNRICRNQNAVRLDWGLQT